MLHFHATTHFNCNAKVYFYTFELFSVVTTLDKTGVLDECIMITVTDADSSRVSMAITRVCDSVCLSVCLSVCRHDKTKTAETEIAKLGTRTVHHDTSPINEYCVKRLKIKVTGSQSA